MKTFILSVLILMIALVMKAQVAINIDGNPPSPCAMLDVSSDSKGVLIPRMTTVQRTAIDSPSEGLLIYDMDTHSFWYIKSSTWTEISYGGAGWSLTGNAGTVNGTSFIGTTDNIPLNFRVNNIPAGKIDPSYMNTFLGFFSGLSSTGSANCAFGQESLLNNVGNSCNTAIGYRSMCNADDRTIGHATYNTGIGYLALEGSYPPSENTGDHNTAIGALALKQNTSGSHNTATGFSALSSNNTGNDNTAIGDSALYYNNSGDLNLAVGANSLYNNSGNHRSTSIGYYSMSNADNRTTGRDTYNTAVGYKALYGSLTPANNTGR